MAQRLGTLLVQQGLITSAQLADALQVQLIFGGRIGTNLVDIGALEVDAVARGLSQLHQVPPALATHFEQIQPETASLVPARLADEYKAIPLGITSRTPKTLAIALMDPHDVGALDELRFALGFRLLVAVAPELRVLYHLEKLYGIARKTRYLRIHTGSQPPPETKEKRSRPSFLLNPDEPEVAAVPSSSIAERASVQTPQMAGPEPLGPSETFEVLELAHDPLTSAAAAPPLRAQASPAEPPVKKGSVLQAAGAAASSSQADAAPAPHPRHVRPALDLAQALAVLAKVKSRDEIGDTVVDYLRSSFGAGLVLIARSEVALGWKGFASGVDDSVIESIAIPLSLPTVFRLAYERHTLFRGAPPAEGDAVHQRLWKLLRFPPPQEVVVAPVILKNRVVNLLYAHAAGGGILPDIVMTELPALCAAAAAAFVEQIRAIKT